MKPLFFVLSATVCLLLTASSLAAKPRTNNTQSDNAYAKAARSVAPVRVVSRYQTVYYITNAPRTGSLIPMVYRRYDNRIDGASNAAVYGSRAVEATGVLDVGTALYRLDPSFTSRR